MQHLLLFPSASPPEAIPSDTTLISFIVYPPPSCLAVPSAELRYLDKAVAIVLGFIGSKMLLSFVDIEVPTDVSLLFVGLCLGGGVAASLLLPEAAETD
jgi:hypothetical protein